MSQSCLCTYSIAVVHATTRLCRRIVLGPYGVCLEIVYPTRIVNAIFKHLPRFKSIINHQSVVSGGNAALRVYLPPVPLTPICSPHPPVSHHHPPKLNYHPHPSPTTADQSPLGHIGGAMRQKIEHGHPVPGPRTQRCPSQC